MLSRAAKEEQVREYNAVFKASPSVMVVEYKGLSVSEMEKLRKDVSAAKAKLTVVKNTLLKIAAKNTDIERIDELFEGPTAVAICESDPSAVAKAFVNTIKSAPMLKLKGGFVDGIVLDANEISELSKLPSRLELIVQFMGLISSPLSNLLGALSQMQTKLLYALEAVKETKEAAVKPEEAAGETQEAVKEAAGASEEAQEKTGEVEEAAEETKEAAAKPEGAAGETQEAVKETEEEAVETEEKK